MIMLSLSALKLCIVLLLMLMPCYHVYCAKVVIEEYKYCEKNAPGKFIMTFDNATPQNINVTMDLPFDLDNKLINIWDIFHVSESGSAVQMAHLVEKRGPCAAMELYSGGIFHDTQRLFRQPVGCPIKKGKYYMRNYSLNQNLLNMMNLPTARLRLKWTWIEKNTNKVVQCCEITGSNHQ